MKRRNFVRQASIGIAGYNLLQSGLSAFNLLQSDHTRSWLKEFVRLTGCREHYGFSHNLIDHAAFLTFHSGMEKDGFLFQNSVFLYPDSDNSCFAVFEKKHNSGLRDIRLGFFRSAGKNDWTHIVTVNGFQLEALLLACKSSTNPAIDPHSILPDAIAKSNTPGIRSSAGHIDITTRIRGNDYVETTISIMNQQRKILGETFRSSHNLTSSAQFA